MKPGNDYFKESIRTLSKVKGVPPRKTRFTKNDNFITISIKNNAENGLDINCFKVIDLIYSLIGPTKTKFTQSNESELVRFLILYSLSSFAHPYF